MASDIGKRILIIPAEPSAESRNLPVNAVKGSYLGILVVKVQSDFYKGLFNSVDQKSAT